LALGALQAEENHLRETGSFSTRPDCWRRSGATIRGAWPSCATRAVCRRPERLQRRQPCRRTRRFREELLFADLEVVTNRIGKLEDQLKKPRPAKQKEIDQQELDLLNASKASSTRGRAPRLWV